MSHQLLEQHEAASRARSMYRRVLVGWASDALRLRASGLDRPSRRDGARIVSPGSIRWTSPGSWGGTDRRVA